MGISRIPAAVEMRVVALIARGDSYEKIRETVQKDLDYPISVGTITAVKRRNRDALDTIKDAILQKEKDDAEGLLVRSHRLIGKQLREAEKDGLPVKLSDLTAISREMFHQTRVAQGGTADPLTLDNPKEKLKQLQDLIEENDEIRLERIVFAKREQTTSLPPQPIEGEQASDGPTDRDML